MADDLLFVYSSPGTVDLAEFNDWYDNEHVPARLAVPGFGAVVRFRAVDGLAPEWLATYDIKPGVLDTPAYKAVWAAASEREKAIMSALATLDRRVYSPVSDSGEPGEPGESGGDARGGPAPVLLAVSMSVPASAEDDLAAWYTEEHIPMLLAVPGWRRIRRYTLTGGSGPRFLSLHELESRAVLDEPAYKAAASTPWRNRVVESAIDRERRVFELHRSFG